MKSKTKFGKSKNLNFIKKKSLSPIISAVLLVVISVILVSVVLSFGQGFTTQGLSDSDKVIKECNQITMFSGSKVDPKGNISFKNISPGNQTHVIIGYKILSTSEDSNFNNFIFFEDENKTVTPGSITIFSIPKFPPEDKFTIQLLTDKGEYISLDRIKNVPENLQDIPQQYDSGALSPGTIANDASIGTLAWSSWTLDNAKLEDDIGAEIGGSSGPYSSNYLKATKFDFNIPTGATIDGIKVEIKKRSMFYADIFYDYEIKIVKSDNSFGNQNKASVTGWTESLEYFTYGNINDLWGETWTAEDINDPCFGVVISVIRPIIGPSQRFADVDHIRMTIYYTN
jgi:hypothetical protein